MALAKNWTQEEVNFLIEHKKKPSAWVALKLGRTKEAVATKKSKLKLSCRGKWTKDEIQFLIDNLGEIPIESIANRLNRSLNAVNQRANLLGFSAVMTSDKISFNELVNELGYGSSYLYLKEKWTSLGLKLGYFKINGRRVLGLEIDQFWKWAEKNQDRLNFKNLEHNAFGYEPEWAKKKIDKDRKLNKQKDKVWTEEEKERLVRLLKNGLDIFRISRELNRSQQAIMSQIIRMDIKYRPKYIDSRKWTDDEKKLLIQMKEKDYSIEEIAEAIGKTTGAVRIKYMRIVGKVD